MKMKHLRQILQTTGSTKDVRNDHCEGLRVSTLYSIAMELQTLNSQFDSRSMCGSTATDPIEHVANDFDIHLIKILFRDAVGEITRYKQCVFNIDIKTK